MKIRCINKSKRLGKYSYKDTTPRRDRDTYKENRDFDKIFQEELKKSEKHLDKNTTE